MFKTIFFKVFKKSKKVLKSFQKSVKKVFKKIVKKNLLNEKTKKFKKILKNFFFKFQKIPSPKKISKKIHPQKSFKKCFQKKFTHLLIMATPKSLFERE